MATEITVEGDDPIEEAVKVLESRDRVADKVKIEITNSIFDTKSLEDFSWEYQAADGPTGTVKEGSVHEKVLEYLADQSTGKVSRRIASETGLNRNSVTPALTDLYHRGLISRTEDIPAKHKITDAGLEEIDRVTQ